MAVAAVFTRTGSTEDVATTQEFGNAALTGTYATGGFTSNPFALSGGAGSSPFPGKTVLSMQWFSPKGYVYVSTVAAGVMTTKIFSAANTELANASAVPDATVPFMMIKTKV